MSQSNAELALGCSPSTNDTAAEKMKHDAPAKDMSSSWFLVLNVFSFSELFLESDQPPTQQTYSFFWPGNNKKTPPKEINFKQFHYWFDLDGLDWWIDCLIDWCGS